MVKASKAAASQLAIKPSINVEPTERPIPKNRASSAGTRPAGMGLDAVRAIFTSMSASYHIFKAPDAPAPIAMQSKDTKPRIGWIEPGAITSPVKAVKTTSDMTRGFNKAK